MVGPVLRWKMSMLMSNLEQDSDGYGSKMVQVIYPPNLQDVA